ncbi:pseudouridine synthase [Sinimarinibacterium sp. CAU 1509]|uniref:pseudouridine synthase n=1 Tax=Sinimarinibacterium sp. CAU 1509 TaxID=2562283 RepID=UPI0010AC6808|nr:pseudouridine synthase [Sinimarinibacterium sp. CAU 1509]TJY62199.1 pseudouridine synthase [Sinimarinibacterium sp. CAU 1509]
MAERIQKLLATAGVASRREIERLIAEGRIQVNGQPAVLGQAVNADDKIRLDGRPLNLSHKTEPTRVLLYKKRVDEVVTRDDPDGRRTVFRKLPALESGRWIAIGRLDINTSGLLLFTNNGELARRLMHPSFQVSRTYAVRMHGTVDPSMIDRMRRGVTLDDGPAKFESIVPGENEDGAASNQWYHVTLREGRNRLVRRLIESQGLQVSRLIRIAYGPISLGRGIKSAASREATPSELNALMAVVGMQPEAGPAGKKARGAAGPGGSKRGPVKPITVGRVSRQSARKQSEQGWPENKRDRGRDSVERDDAGGARARTSRSRPGGDSRPSGQRPTGGARKQSGAAEGSAASRSSSSARPSATRAPGKPSGARIEDSGKPRSSKPGMRPSRSGARDRASGPGSPKPRKPSR